MHELRLGTPSAAAFLNELPLLCYATEEVRVVILGGGQAERF